MSRERLLFFGILLVLLAGTFGLLLWPKVAESIAPEPVRAWVAIEVEGEEEVARVGRFEVSPETEVTLHAVLEAEDGGEPLYYTNAPALEIDGEVVPPERIRPWDRHLEPRILWFTVEGVGPFLKLETPEDLEKFRFTELFRPDWPRTWSVPARVASQHSRHLKRSEAERQRSFGVQRYHVRIDLVDPVDPLIVKKSAQSWGADEVLEREERFPTLLVELEPPLEVVSRYFGLTQLIPSDVVLPELSEEISRLAEDELAFTRAFLLRAHLEDAGRRWEDLSWRRIDWSGGDLRWGSDVRPGDLLRVASRAVILYDDRGAEGVLDDEDLCVDFERGAALVPIGEIFTGEGLVEWASLGTE